jgi:Concanavalin A-like lectin/glucanases superfamily
VRVTNPAPEAGNAIMPHQPKPQPHPSVIDPDNIPETFATGPLNIEVTGPVAILTFTHARNDICDLMAGKQRIASAPVPYFRGAIDDLRIYNRALSATEVQQLYNAGR